jgi:hypothetical protein
MATNKRQLNEKYDRNLELYKRWQIDGEPLNQLLVEYEISYPAAYKIKELVERKYPEELQKLV